MKINNKLKQIINVIMDSLGGVFYVGILSIIAVCVAIAFKNSKFGNLLEIKDYFNFAGSFGGAILGGFISLIILKVTLKEQRKQFEEQRKIEDTRREEDRKQFERQLEEERNRFEKEYNIDLINDKLKSIKEVYKLYVNIKIKINDMLLNNYLSGKQITPEEFRDIIALLYEYYITICTIDLSELDEKTENIYEMLEKFKDNEFTKDDVNVFKNFIDIDRILAEQNKILIKYNKEISKNKHL